MLKAVRRELISRRHEAVPELGTWLRSVVQGHLNYFAVPGTKKAIDAFRTEVIKACFTPYSAEATRPEVLRGIA
jgi:hypothetical protein